MFHKNKNKDKNANEKFITKKEKQYKKFNTEKTK